MHRFAPLARAVPALSLALASPVQAQPEDRMYRPPEASARGEIGFFSGAGFQGRSYYVTGPRTNLNIPFMARSYRVARGDSWELCARTEYRQPCQTVSASSEDRGIATGFQVRSARPLGFSGGNGGGDGDFSGSGYAGPSLQGMASEFFRAPEDRGRRVIACRSGSVSAACMAQTADRFCRTRGYAGGAAYQRGETVRRETYLADVLCSRSGM